MDFTENPPAPPFFFAPGDAKSEGSLARMFASCIPVWGCAAAEPSLRGFQVVGQNVSASLLRVLERGGLLAGSAGLQRLSLRQDVSEFQICFFKTASLCSRQGSRFLISIFCSCKYRCWSVFGRYGKVVPEKPREDLKTLFCSSWKSLDNFGVSAGRPQGPFSKAGGS